ncbi:Gfo/Idh/MocA family protein [Mariniplasma anaerobium]|uniref:Dehydrogenase n=1 Tax=Mariniplasma anaerobium TaxID=2735436 RepID=A0A7U9TIC3_9MOLU|nr:Gfo/Idh/MocA family oxidoreductase [Mariniplasma anaerobium]BCR35768.1 dehydrogenase [Mariniplasma anaerobium]
MIRFGIVGAGGIAEKFATDIKSVKNAKAVAIASRDLERANKFKDKFNLDYAFDSYEKMAESDLIDAVYIATPHSFHKEQSIMFMNHKKHVLCEKPIAVNSQQFEDMVVSSQKNKVLLMEAMWTKFLPATIKLREVVHSGVLGKLKHAYIEFGQDLRHIGGDTGRLFNMNLAGGCLLDMGIYPLSYTLNLTDSSVKTIKAKAEFHHTGVDTKSIVDFVFDDGSSAKLISSFMEVLDAPSVFEFEKGNIVVDHFHKSEKVIIKDKTYYFPHVSGGFEYEIEAFSKTIEDGLLENDIMTHEQTRKSMKLLDRTRKVFGLKYPFED